MSISTVNTFTGTNTATLSAIQAGDLLLAFSFRDGSTTAPGLPTGFTNIEASGANTCSARAAFKIADGSETSVVSSNASSIIVAQIRGHDAADPIGGSAITGAASTTISYPAITMQTADGSSRVFGFAGHRSTNVAIETPPTGMTNLVSVSDATDEAALHATPSGVSSWSAATASVGGTSSGWRAITVEIRAGMSEMASRVGISPQAVVTSGDITLSTTGLSLQAGDLLVAGISYRGSQPFTAPAGWTIHHQESQGNTTVNDTGSIASGLIASTIYTGSAPSLTFTRSGGDLAIGFIEVWRPANGKIFELDVANGGTMASADNWAQLANALTTTQANTVVIGVCCVARGLGGTSAFQNSTSPLTWTQRADHWTTSAAGGGCAIYTATKASAGALGTVQWWNDYAARQATILAAFYETDPPIEEYEEEVAETASATDAAAAQLAANGVIAETAAGADATAAGLALTAAVSESAAVADAPAAALALQAQVAESVAATDSTNSALPGSTEITEQTAAADAVAAGLAAVAAVAETASASDAVVGQLRIDVGTDPPVRGGGGGIYRRSSGSRRKRWAVEIDGEVHFVKNRREAEELHERLKPKPQPKPRPKVVAPVVRDEPPPTPQVVAPAPDVFGPVMAETSRLIAELQAAAMQQRQAEIERDLRLRQAIQQALDDDDEDVVSLLVH